MNAVLGIDPGASGGIAYIDHDGCATAWKMPETERDTYELLRTMDRAGAKAWIERCGPMPKQGVVSVWKFSGNYHGLRAFLIALEIPFEAVAPGVWQRSLGCLTHGDKRITKAKAQELYPTLKIGHATADALLIATYGRGNGANA